jgi:TolA-binding protein
MKTRKDKLTLNTKDFTRYLGKNSFNITDESISEAIDIYMKAYSDIEEVVNDPLYSIIDRDVVKMISDWKKSKNLNKVYDSEIRDDISIKRKDAEVELEINDIENDIKQHDIDLETLQWIKDWKEGMQHRNKPAHDRVVDWEQKKEMRARISVLRENGMKKKYSSVILWRIIPLAAASLLGILILFRSILGPADYNSLFNSNYRPFESAGSVTRTFEIKGTDNFSSALEYYKNGDFLKAAAIFSNLAENDSSSAVLFFTGLSMIETGEYSKAAGLFEICSERSDQFQKESKWYLGLISLKKGDIARASDCFNSLSSASGYYSVRARKILRRLK